MASLRRLFNELIVVFLLGLVQPRRLGENIEVLLRRGLVLLHLHEPLDEQLGQLAEIERSGEAFPDSDQLLHWRVDTLLAVWLLVRLGQLCCLGYFCPAPLEVDCC